MYISNEISQPKTLALFPYCKYVLAEQFMFPFELRFVKWIYLNDKFFPKFKKSQYEKGAVEIIIFQP